MTGSARGATHAPERHILRCQCRDDIGIVADVAGFLAAERLLIHDSADFGDPETGQFFIRVEFSPTSAPFSREAFSRGFGPIAARRAMTWELSDRRIRPNVLILVSKSDHCLNDLLYRRRIGSLPMQVPAIVSNHLDCAWLASRHDIPFLHVPATSNTRAQAEARLREIIADTRADLVVLARYMQVLSDDLTRELAGRCINIHHSFLPSFKGAQPYHQAYQRGVKLIGATAHYVTADLDDGPIIAQAVEPVDHRATPDAMVARGRDIEARVLAEAVRAHVEGRIFPNGHKTVVFS
jgi:formyltetrahydrofolate deformylase